VTDPDEPEDINIYQINAATSRRRKPETGNNNLALLRHERHSMTNVYGRSQTITCFQLPDQLTQIATAALVCSVLSPPEELVAPQAQSCNRSVHGNVADNDFDRSPKHLCLSSLSAC
jgi:hypothetical protein